MAQEANIGPMLEALNPLCTAGYALALHIKYTTPALLFQTYSREWADHYNQHGLVIHDPVVRWGFENIGSIAWGSLKNEDPQGVLQKCSDFGMKFGTVISIYEGDSRSIGGFARNDRDHTDAEIQNLEAQLRKIHEYTAATKELSVEDRAALKNLSITLTHNS